MNLATNQQGRQNSAGKNHNNIKKVCPEFKGVDSNIVL
jgi:hypothetical protein